MANHKDYEDHQVTVYPPSYSISHPPQNPITYADPPLRYPLIQLSELPDPPEDWIFLGSTHRGVFTGRKLRRSEVEQAVDFYSWGINMEIPRMSIEVGARALWKLFYNHAPQHRPASYADLKDFTRDAGPRLLSVTLDHPDLRPISRYYPDPPDARKVPSPGYVRPLNAAPSIPDSYLEQMGYPAVGGAVDLHHDDAKSESEQSDDSMKICGCPRDTAPLSAVTARAVIESVERAVLRFALPQLERDPSAVPRHAPRPQLTAEMDRDLLKVIMATYPATSTLKLSSTNILLPHRYVFDPIDGQEFPYRGRGPVWNNNSSAIDCIIVAGMLLDAGSTKMDRADPAWPDNLHTLQRAFIEATDANWGTCSMYTGWTLRDRFWAIASAYLNNVYRGGVGPLWDIWRASTAKFAQFTYSCVEEIHSCPCTKTETVRIENDNLTTVNPLLELNSHNPVPMQELLNRAFFPEYKLDCPKCGAKDTIVRERAYKSLPARMVVTIDGTQAVRQHTRDMNINYVDTDGHPRSATYRWLGGIYCRDGHFRLYWTESQRGERDSGEIAVYDSTMCQGAIIGGVPQEHRHDKVPEQWWKNQILPLVFYERIDNPNPEVLNLALQTVSDMVHADSHGRNLLQTQAQWHRHVPSDTRNHRWRRLLPTTADRFMPVDLVSCSGDCPEPVPVPGAGTLFSGNGLSSFAMTPPFGMPSMAAPATPKTPPTPATATDPPTTPTPMPRLNAMAYPDTFLQAGLPAPIGYPPSAYEYKRDPASLTGLHDESSVLGPEACPKTALETATKSEGEDGDTPMM